MPDGRRQGVMAGGNWIVDHIKMVDVYPAQDALANIVGQSLSNGGSPFNILMDLAKLQAPFPLEAVGLVGQDAEGEWIRQVCETHRIGTAGLVATASAPTSFTDAMTVTSTGRRTFFHQRGANAYLDQEHFDFSTTRARIFHLGYLLLLDRLDGPDNEYETVAARVLKLATDAGLLTSVDVVSEDGDRFQRVVRPALKHTDLCVMNEFEAERSTGIPLRVGAELRAEGLPAAAAELLKWGVRRCVVIHYPEGAFALEAHGPSHFQGSVMVPQSKIAGTNGAGDAFAAGLLYGLHEGLPMAQCLRDAVSTAAICLTDASTSGGIAPLAACRQFSQQHGFRSA